MTTKDEIERLFRENFKSLLTLAMRLTHDEQTAKDIVHDVFASLLDGNVETVTPAYLLTGVRFACLKHIRSLDTRQRLNNLYALDLNEIEDEEWPDEEDIAKLNEIIETQLSEQVKKTVKLRFTEKMTYKEIASQLRVSEVTVYKHLRHALIVLRQNFNRHG